MRLFPSSTTTTTTSNNRRSNSNSRGGGILRNSGGSNGRGGLRSNSNGRGPARTTMRTEPTMPRVNNNNNNSKTASSDPWTQADWPEHRGLSEDWKPSSWQNREDEGSQQRPIEIVDDPLVSRERDILAKHQQDENNHKPRKGIMRLFGSNKNRSSAAPIKSRAPAPEVPLPRRTQSRGPDRVERDRVRAQPPPPEWNRPVHDRLFSSDDVLPNEPSTTTTGRVPFPPPSSSLWGGNPPDQDDPTSTLPPQQPPSKQLSPTEQSEMSGLTDPTFHSKPKILDPFDVAMFERHDPFAIQSPDSNGAAVQEEVFPDPFFGDSPTTTKTTRTNTDALRSNSHHDDDDDDENNDDPALDCVDMVSENGDDDDDEEQEHAVPQEHTQHPPVPRHVETTTASESFQDRLLARRNLSSPSSRESRNVVSGSPGRRSSPARVDHSQQTTTMPWEEPSLSALARQNQIPSMTTPRQSFEVRSASASPTRWRSNATTANATTSRESTPVRRTKVADLYHETPFELNQSMEVQGSGSMEASPARRSVSSSPGRTLPPPPSTAATRRTAAAHRRRQQARDQTSSRSSPRNRPDSFFTSTRQTTASPVVPKPPEPGEAGKRRNKPPPRDDWKAHDRTNGMPSNRSFSDIPQPSSTSESISSVGSDIRRLRSILKRNRGSNDDDNGGGHQDSLQSAFALQYDDRDPMQRAGLRLLSAAVVPIQCLVRKHLALREALTRMWAIVIIQACARRWFVQSRARRERQAVIKIQSTFRAGVVRDQLLLEQCCAIEIQRHVRGLLATLDVYEKIYKITVIQSAFRKHLAMNKAMDRMVSIIQIQSVARTWSVRSKLAKKHASATKIQTYYRTFNARFNYQLDLLDIVIAQSVWRRRQAKRLANSKRHQKQTQAAVLIQTQWRSYDCTMNYLHFLADVLIAQSAARRWKACRLAKDLKQRRVVTIQSFVRMSLARNALKRRKAAVVIQRTWRGFVCYADYMFTIADIVIVQSLTRRHLAQKRCTILSAQRRRVSAVKIQGMARIALYKNRKAALTIQRYWRGFVCATELMILKYEHRAATLIQSSWRRYWNFSNFIITLDSVMMIQAVVRGHQCATFFQQQKSSAITIQRSFRAFHQRRESSIRNTANAIVSQSVFLAKREEASAAAIQRFYTYQSLNFSERQNAAASTLQAQWRKYIIQTMYVDFISARRIQSLFRGYIVRKARVQKSAACRIQTRLRGFQQRRSFLEYISARKIQTRWRRYAVRSLYTDYKASQKIQAVWRGYSTKLMYLDFMLARKIQSWYRGCAARKLCREHIAARQIQSIFRGQSSRSQTTALSIIGTGEPVSKAHTLGAITIQTNWRGSIVRTTYVDFVAAKRIQTAWRGYNARASYVKFCAARIIQKHARGYWIRNCYVEYTAARSIQALIRAYLIRYCYTEYKAARIIQKYARAYFVKTSYHEYSAARNIQKIWRGHNIRASYLFFISARKIQAQWRCFMIQTSCRFFLAARRIQSAWRRKHARIRFEQLRSDMMVDEIKACSKIQKCYRGHQTRKTVPVFNAWKTKLSKKYLAATKIQSHIRAHSAQLRYWECLGSSIQLERMVRGWVARCKVGRQLANHRAARKIQSMVRGTKIRHSFRSLGAAIQIQAEFRRYEAQMRFLEKIGSIIVIQTIARGYLGRKDYKERRIINLIVNHANSIPADLEKDFEEMVRQQERQNAARKIQKFFLWVKAEVDREVQHRQKKKRERKQRKHQRLVRRSTKDDDDDDLLENVFATILPTRQGGTGGTSNSKMIRDAEAAAAREIRRHKDRATADDPHMVAIPEEYRIATGLNGQNFPRTLLLQKNSNNRRDHDVLSDVSSSVYYRVPPPRFNRFTSKQMDDDFSLEEAWIDTEILNTKERRQLDRRQKKSSVRGKQRTYLH